MESKKEFGVGLNTEQKVSVMFVEDDPHFADLLRSIIQTSDRLELKAGFNSIEAFVNAQASGLLSGNWYPDVLVMDVMSATDIRFDGATFANSMRSNGVRIGVVLISSMPLGKILEVFRKTNPGGWRALQKSSRLNGEEIVGAIIEAAEEMRKL